MLAVSAATATIVVGVALAQLYLTRAGFASHSFDGALYTRSLWGVAHGDWNNALREQHALALHSHYILVLLAPLARAFGAYAVLFAAQSLALAAYMGVLAWATLKIMGRGGWGCLALAALAINPLLLNGFVNSVRPMTFAVPALLYAGVRLLVERRAGASVYAALLLAALCREETGILTAVLGGALVASSFVDASTWRALRRPGLILALMGGALALLYYGLVQPSLGADSEGVRRHFGAGGNDLFSAANAEYLVWVLGSVGGLALIAPRALLVAAPVIAGNLLSGHFGGGNLQSHYQLLAAPFLVCGALIALSRFSGRSRALALAALTVGSMTTYIAHAVTPGGHHFHSVTWTGMPWTGAANDILEAIGPDASASAPPYFVNHLAERPVATVLDTHARPGSVEYVVIDRIPVSTAAHSAQEYEQARRDQFGWLTRRGYEVVLVAAPFALLRHEVDGD